MANKELTQDEIQKLFKFVKSKNVHFIDVQHEIVDHLASAIEEKQNDDPNLSFDTALKQVYSGFPITGFGELTAAKHSAMIKYWSKKFFGFMLSYLKLPKIALFAFLSYCIYLILLSGTRQTFAYFYLSCFTFLVGCVIYRYRTGFEFKKNFREKYLVTNAYLSWYGGIWMIYFFFPFDISFGDFTDTTELEFSIMQRSIFSFYISSILLWIHAFHFEFPEMLKQELEEKYKHLNLKIS